MIWFAVILLMPFVLSSTFICAPKWWRNRVRPFLKPIAGPDVEDLLDSLDASEMPQFLRTIIQVVKESLRLVAFLVVLLFCTACCLVAFWLSSAVALITLKCPYTSQAHRQIYLEGGWNGNNSWKLLLDTRRWLKNPVASAWRIVR